MREAIRGARSEGDEIAGRELSGTPRRRPSQPLAPWAEALSVRIRGAALETRRRLRPVGRAIRGGIGRVAHPLTHGLFVVLRVPVALIATGLDLFLELWRPARGRIGAVAAALAALVGALAERLTPVRVLAAVTVVTAIALAGSQFADYRGVAVGDPQYPAGVARVAPPPLTDVEPTGSAHLYALVPAAVLVVVLTWLTLQGRWRLGRAIALVGIAGIALALIVDRPAGLDAGTAGVAYLGTEPQLLEGFWAEIAACAALIVCGPLLGWHVRIAASEGGRDRGAAPARSRALQRGPRARSLEAGA